MEVRGHEQQPCRPRHTLSERTKSCGFRLAHRTAFPKGRNSSNKRGTRGKDVSTLSTHTNKRHGLGAERFSRFSSLSSLQRAIANLIVLVKEFKRRKVKTHELRERKPVTTKNEVQLRDPTLKELQQAMTVIIKAAQEEVFGEELKSRSHAHFSEKESSRERISERKSVMKKSALYRLDPFVDDNGILRVGGRLQRARLEYKEKRPVLLPKGHHVSKLIVRHYHSQVHHQGRQITHGAI